MQNKVFINEKNIIETWYAGDQSVDTLRNMLQKCYKMSEILRKKGEPILILANISSIGKTDHKGLIAVIGELKRFPFDKIAIYGTSLYFKTVSNFIAYALHIQTKMMYFNTREEAEKWLLYKN